MLTINGNGGFVGSYLNNSFLHDLTKINQIVTYYFLVIIILLIFLISINFKLKLLPKLISSLLKLFKKKEKKLINTDIEANTNKEDVFDKDENRTQENFAFNEKTKNKKISFKLPKDNILNEPKNNVDKPKSELDISEDFLEKILLDFGVEGKIKKINKGPVVTLNEFEPAAGVKVSKIINLSEDIARNTSSESARISTIPGSNTIGIELPNVSREDVYLKEIISNPNF